MTEGWICCVGCNSVVADRNLRDQGETGSEHYILICQRGQGVIRPWYQETHLQCCHLLSLSANNDQSWLSNNTQECSNNRFRIFLTLIWFLVHNHNVSWPTISSSSDTLDIILKWLRIFSINRSLPLHPTKTYFLQGMVRLPVKLLRFLVKLIFWLWRLGAVPSNHYCSKWLSICELISSTSERWGLLRLSQLTLSSGLTINLLFDRVMPPHPTNNLLSCSPLSSNNQFQ